MKIYHLVLFGTRAGLLFVYLMHGSGALAGNLPVKQASGVALEQTSASTMEGEVNSAESAAILDAKNEAEIVQKIRSRTYPGGSDESDLRVQSQLAKPTRKVAPTVEDESEPAADD
jgi:hypothetical protein